MILAWSTVQIDRGGPEVAVAELALDDDHRDAFVRRLDRVRLTLLVGAKRRRTPAGGRPPQVSSLAALDHGRPPVAPLMTQVILEAAGNLTKDVLDLLGGGIQLGAEGLEEC